MGFAATTASAFAIVPSRLLGKGAPSNKLSLALIGVGAMRFPGTRLQWDSTKMAFDNKDATALVTPEYRKGWTL